MKVELTIVGGGGDYEQTIDEMLALPQHSFVKRIQRIHDVERLRAIYQQHTILAMPSFTETFGIVYLEALSQGLTIIHSRGQGVDGYFTPGTISEGVDPHSFKSVADAIVRLADRGESIRNLCVSEAHRFSWESIGQSYGHLYESVCEGNSPVTAGQIKHNLPRPLH
jgi:glycosyltransferase involved in cell wall biosynthesis